MLDISFPSSCSTQTHPKLTQTYLKPLSSPKSSDVAGATLTQTFDFLTRASSIAMLFMSAEKIEGVLI
jgi:hypothetical protein